MNNQNDSTTIRNVVPVAYSCSSCLIKCGQEQSLCNVSNVSNVSNLSGMCMWPLDKHVRTRRIRQVRQNGIGRRESIRYINSVSKLSMTQFNIIDINNLVCLIRYI